MSPVDTARARIGALDPNALSALCGRSMLLTRDWERSEIETLCSLAELFQDLDRAGIRTPLFEHELFYAMFFDASTRTKSSWAGAAARLGAHPNVVDGSTTQVSHGETARETGAMVGMNSHALGVRHDLILGEGNRFMRDALAGIEEYLGANGEERTVPMVNLQCDIDHPTQAVADLLWIRENFGSGNAVEDRNGSGLEGRTVVMSWAYSPSYAKPLSVAQGTITLLTRFGMNVRLAHPEGYDLMPSTLESAAASASESGGTFTQMHDMDAAFDGADIVYPKSWGPYDLMQARVEANRNRDSARMGEIEREALERNKSHRSWICDESRMARTRGGKALYMHCLPADIGAEVSAGVLEQYRTRLAQEANKKVYAIMALLAASKSRDLHARLRALLP